MNILTKITLRFSVIVASILALFFMAIYLLSASYRQEEFYERLKTRAETTFRLRILGNEFGQDVLQLIDKNAILALPEEKVLVFNGAQQLLYRSVEDTMRQLPAALFDRVMEQGEVRYVERDYELLGLRYEKAGENFVVIASAYDRYGRSKLSNLGTVLLVGLLVGLVVTVLAGRIFAAQILTPLARMNNQVMKITAGNLDQRIDEGNKKDEIARLAINFNQMLKRLGAAFEVQQSFVSNASHELRTPLAVMRSQLQVVLERDRTSEEYRQVLRSLLDDTNSFSELTAGLLTLAQSGVENQRQSFGLVRVDEALFAAQEELARRRPAYRFLFDYENLPENENDLTLRGNEQLLMTAFTNLMDNACKFSPDQTVYISLSSQEKHVEIRFRDQGIGIEASELRKIFSPFYRTPTAQGAVRGHGIGLSLCQRIVTLHRGGLFVESEPGRGSIFKVVLPLDQE